MNKKFLTVGMVMPFVAAGAISTGPGASAAPSPHGNNQPDRVSCTLDANALRGRESDRIIIEFKLRSDPAENSNWKVEIEQNGDGIDREYLRTDHGSLKVVTVARDKRGTDWFMATATNLRTGQQCWAFDSVR